MVGISFTQSLETSRILQERLASAPANEKRTALEQKIAQLQSLSPDANLLKKADSLLHDFNKVRPIEKKLILKMAREIKTYGDYLRSIGMNPPEHDDSLFE